ncbi:hypothetical protein DIREPILLOW8_192 [Vibrio phage Direpillow8]|uniref:Uncharacterized protein n=1 Tax=Vibrio phage Brizo TaxID=2590896 RepID=A0A4Y6E817_9CAUD|nr:hypothetical protein KNU58_gp104 [Vibrio phage Brizo]QDF14579.1 hypothetical protein BRIZO_182 [Vibrio phage Brizo]QKN85612.1 hypothetical protein DIREPILLOW8_192 [Vibrio phage Direpillow8]WBU77170.1 hypothetical protein NOELLE_186 [Vibrio phage Noelle]
MEDKNKRTYGLFVRGGNTHQKLAFSCKSTSAAEAMKSFAHHYQYKLGVNPDKMETFFVIPKIGDNYDFYSADSNGWDIGDTFYPACNKPYAHLSLEK